MTEKAAEDPGEREADEYILGTDPLELERLRFQHQTWRERACALWEKAGIREGQAVLDLGAGPGYTSLELARIVGRSGRVIARDRSPRFVAYLARECERLGQSHVEASQGDAETLDLPDGSLDAVYTRWLLCWLPDAGAALARIARCVKPDGLLLVQDYLDWGSLRLVPGSEVFDRMVAACMRSWREGDGTIDIGRSSRSSPSGAASASSTSSPSRGWGASDPSNGDGSAGSSRATSRGSPRAGS